MFYLIFDLYFLLTGQSFNFKVELLHSSPSKKKLCNNNYSFYRGREVEKVKLGISHKVWTKHGVATPICQVMVKAMLKAMA